MCVVVETPFVCLPYVGVDHNLPAPKNVRQGVMVVTSNAKHEKNLPVAGQGWHTVGCLEQHVPGYARHLMTTMTAASFGVGWGWWWWVIGGVV